MSISTITPQSLAQLCRDGKKIELIDVRSAAEYAEVRVPIARNLPLDQLDPASLLRSRQGAAGEPVYVICRSGGRSLAACQKLAQAGLANVVNVEGGTQGWEACGLPVVRGKNKKASS